MNNGHYIVLALVLFTALSGLVEHRRYHLWLIMQHLDMTGLHRLTEAIRTFGITIAEAAKAANEFSKALNAIDKFEGEDDE